jgi:hypothetical protein
MVWASPNILREAEGKRQMAKGGQRGKGRAIFLIIMLGGVGWTLVG